MGLYRRKESPIWWMTFYANGKRYRQTTGTANQKLAERVFAKIQTQVTENKWFDIDYTKQKTLREMIERYDREYSAQRKYYPRKRDKSVFKNLYYYFGESCTLGEIDQKVGGYEQFRRAKGISPATVVKELGLLRAMFNIARKQWRWKIANPVSDIKLPKVRNERIRYLSEDEYKRLLDSLDASGQKWLKPMVIIAIDTGLRLTNICDLKWTEVNLFGKMITLDAEAMKNDDYLGVPLTERAFQVLKELHKAPCLSGHVFHENGRKIYDRQLQRAFRGLLKKAGISNFHFHDLRHTFASYLRQNGVDLHTISKLLGHRDLRMTKRYAHLNVDALRAAVSRLDGHILGTVTDEKHAETV